MWKWRPIIFYFDDNGKSQGSPQCMRVLAFLYLSWHLTSMQQDTNQCNKWFIYIKQ